MVLYVPSGIDWSQPTKEVLVTLLKAYLTGNIHPAPPSVISRHSQASNTIQHCLLDLEASHNSSAQHQDSTLDSSGAQSVSPREDATVSSDDSLSTSMANTSSIMLVDLDSPPSSESPGSSSPDVVVLSQNPPPCSHAPVPRASTPLARNEVSVSRPRPSQMDTLPIPSSVSREAATQAAVTPDPLSRGLYPDLAQFSSLGQTPVQTLQPAAPPLASSTTKYQFGSEDIRFPRGATAAAADTVQLTLDETTGTMMDNSQNSSNAAMDQDTSSLDSSSHDASLPPDVEAAAAESSPGEDAVPAGPPSPAQGNFWEHESDSPANAVLHHIWFRHKGLNRMIYPNQDGQGTVMTEFCAYCQDHRALPLSTEFAEQIDKWKPLINYIRQQILDTHVDCVNPYCQAEGSLRVLSDANSLSLPSAWDIWRVFCTQRYEALDSLFTALRAQAIRGPSVDIFALHRQFNSYYQDYMVIPPGHAPQIMAIPSYDAVGSVPVAYNANITHNTKASQFECKVCYQRCKDLWVIYSDCG